MDAVREADRVAILRVLEEETTAYFNKDYEGWARCWVEAPYTRRMGWYARGGVLVQTREQDAGAMKLAMEKYPAPNRSAQEVRRENVNIRAREDMAWVTFEQIAPKTGDPFDVPGRQHEARILEKHAGEGAAEQIRHHDHLRLIGGRLRAHNRATDQRLQASCEDRALAESTVK